MRIQALFILVKSCKVHGKQHTLLVDGMWRYGRNILYVMSIIMVIVSVGRNPTIPKLFCPLFFTYMSIHRSQRDDQRCR